MQGKSNLDHYIKGFLANKSPYRVLDSDKKVIGFSREPTASGQPSSIYARFDALGRKRKEVENELIANIDKIKKIVKKEELRYTAADTRTSVERIFSGLLEDCPEFDQERDILHELQFEPTEKQLRQIISSYASLDAASPIRNVGFVYNNGKRIMLSGINVELQIEINAQRENNHIISASSLLSAMADQKKKLLRPLDGSATGQES